MMAWHFRLQIYTVFHSKCYPCQEDCQPQEAEFGRRPPQISLEYEACPQTADHVAEEAKCPN